MKKTERKRYEISEEELKKAFNITDEVILCDIEYNDGKTILVIETEM
jgi:hypothetical protein